LRLTQYSTNGTSKIVAKGGNFQTKNGILWGLVSENGVISQQKKNKRQNGQAKSRCMYKNTRFFVETRDLSEKKYFFMY